ncbi:MAG: ATP-binding protein [Ilumatobacter sp.]|uniref:ATP-binding protein n=1 Tax=Ilumatobacter sp. TaxID=1967498 RepID=UPI003C7366E9
MTDGPGRAPRSADRLLTGAAAGWAQRHGLDPTVVRVALAVLGLTGGLGVALYAVLVVRTGTGSATERAVEPELRQVQRDPRRDLAVVAGSAAVLVAARSTGLWAGDAIMVAVLAVAVGVVVVWSPDLGFGAGLPIGWRRRPLVRRGAQVVIGSVLLAAGVISLADRTGGLGNVGASAAAIAVVVGGLAAFAAPALGKILRQLDDERSQRIREDEMARVSAHLHDSVLQSLVLIQRSADPREMTSLARRQERELRAWLYGDVPLGEATTVAAAVEQLTTAIESDHHLRVEAVVVGDQPLDDAAATLLAALREAVVNAARHADVDRVDVFVEADPAELTAFVRDTGIGFDLASARSSHLPGSHRGIEDSIIGRVRRAGGTSVIESRPGVGTEVEISVPRVQG